MLEVLLPGCGRILRPVALPSASRFGRLPLTCRPLPGLAVLWRWSSQMPLRRSLPRHQVFPAPPSGLRKLTGLFAGQSVEYVKICVRQLRAGLLSLAHSCSAGSAVFLVIKAHGRQRVVWHGTRCSEAAAKPPKPRLMSNPSVLAFLQRFDGRQLRVTKRHCCTWFDQLVLPLALSPFMARPRVSARELLDAGFSASGLRPLSCRCEKRRQCHLAVSVGPYLAHGILLEQLRGVRESARDGAPGRLDFAIRPSGGRSVAPRPQHGLRCRDRHSDASLRC